MIKIPLNNKTSVKVYEGYIRRVQRMIKILSEENQKELLMEINSHIHESLQKSEPENETNELLDTLERLGEPEDFLIEMVADRKMEQAAKTGNPIDLLQALRLNIGRGIKHVLLAILYFFSFCLTLLVPLKLIFPNNVGYFKQGDAFASFGYISDNEGLTEVLGWWFIPMIIGIIVVLYYGILWALKTQIKNK